ncbi:MAG: hypothetical protein H6815_08855 [Phycisphaeraceae bacterium]|nr:hypothetical protein [Phycisphaeraceae bacterium]
MVTKDQKLRCACSARWKPFVEPVAYGVLAVLVAGSAIATKELGHNNGAQPLAAIERVETHTPVISESGLGSHIVLASHESTIETHNIDVPDVEIALDNETVQEETVEASTEEIRWFNGRPVRQARTVKMRVTAYAPDHRSCGPFADGKTATLHSVDTNGGALVAADPKLFSYGTMLTVPGYDNDQIVPVLDCGGAIKGHKLDVLFPTHREARKWGVREVEVVVWEYADDLPAPNVRELR